MAGQKYSLRLLLCLIVTTICIGQTPQGGFRPDFISQWSDFRAAYPYHIQTIGLSSPAQDGHRLLLLAEPPPHVTLTGLRELDSSAFANTLEQTHPIGADGWTKDLLVDLPAMQAPELNSLLDSIAAYLFYTSYKSNVITLPVRAPTLARQNLDLRVSAADLHHALLFVAESTHRTLSFPIFAATAALGLVAALFLYVVLLRRWVERLRHPARLRLLSSLAGVGLVVLLCLTYRFWPSSTPTDNSFVSVNGGEPVTARQILDDKQSGVFMSVDPGILLWSLNRTTPLSGYQAEFRQFALDSDLLLGAVRSGDQIVVVGRERVVPLDALPPLRSETMMLLSSADTGELAQSYERTQLLAGRLRNHADSDFGHDWAPIYLSDQLIDTEYGSLLNITDQLLKSWSMHGEVKYTRFDYPPPPEFPFPEALPKLADTRTLLFNWNTKGAGYIVQQNPYDIYALNRTGALPIDYRAAGNARLEANEDTAYEKFAGYSDPNLVRVVQYAALYQIFRQFQTVASTVSFEHSAPPLLLRAQTQRILQWFMSPEGTFASSLQNAHIPEDYQRRLLQVRDHLVDASQSVGLPQLLDFLTNRQSLDAVTAQDFEALSNLDMEMSGLSQAIQAVLHLDISTVKNAYLNQSRDQHSGWIHTPTVVISWGEGTTGYEFIGGHNLSAKVSLFQPDPALRPGEVRVEQDAQSGRQVINHSPSDADKVADIVRGAGRYDEKSPDLLQKKLEEDLHRVSVSNRNLRAVLGVDTGPKPDSERGFRPSLSPGAVRDVGWQLSSRGVSSRETALIRAIQNGIVISRQPDGTYSVAHKSAPKSIEASSLPAAISAARACVVEGDGSSDVNLLLTGFEERQGRSFAQSLELSLEGEQKKVISIAIEGEPIEPGELDKVLNANYEYSKATIENISSPVEETDGRTSVTADLKLQANTRSLIVRIKLFFRARVRDVARLASAIAEAVVRWQSAIANLPDKVHFLVAHKLLLRELRKVDPYLEHVHSTISIEGKDLYATDRNSRPFCGTECYAR